MAERDRDTVVTLNAALDSIDARSVAVAFSGGLDSTVLLHACCAHLGAAQVLALHVHHGLQAAADDFARHAQAFAERLGVHCQVIQLEGRPAAAQSVEAWASEARYQALAARAGSTPVLTAHHEDDQAETVLLRLLRGTGERGLGGIRPRIERYGGCFLRPLLGVPRAALEAYAREHQLVWVEDPSNASHRFARNALRQRLMPVVEELAPGAAHRLARAASHAREDQSVLRGYQDEDLAALVSTVPPASAAPRIEVLDLDALRMKPPARAAALLRRWIERLGVEPPGTARHAVLVSLALDVDASYGQWTHSGTVWFKYRRQLVSVAGGKDMLLRLRLNEPEQLSSQRAQAWPSTCTSSAGRIQLTWPTEADRTAPRPAVRLYLSRFRSGSERFQRTGQQHARSLKDLLQDLGVPRWLRPVLPVLRDETGKPVWVLGLGAGSVELGQAKVDWQWASGIGEPLPEHRLVDWFLARSGL